MTPILDFVPRPRRPFEALDLGLSLLQAHWRPAMGVFCLQLGILLALVLPFTWRQPVWTLLLLWWLSPWLGRGVLHVLSRRVFGQDAGVLTFLRGWGDIHRHGLLACLLWRRLSPAASFLMPLWQLEHQSGAGYRQRSRVLLRRSAGTAFLLALTCLLLEGLTLLGILGLLQMLVPRGMPLNLLEELGRGFDHPWFAWTFTALGVLAFTLVEPFFSAAGFALYLNRRTMLEGWDLERAFRGLAARLQVAGLLLLLALAGMSARAQEAEGPEAPTALTAAELKVEAQPLRPEDPARKQLEELLAKDPDFAHTRLSKTTHYHPTGKEPRWLRALLDALFGEHKPAQRRSSEPPPAWLPVLAWVMKLLLIAGLIGLALFLIYRFRNAWQGPAPRGEDYVPPEALAGLDIRPESLPPDVAGEALLRFRMGDARGALALLYRGALVALIHGHRLEIAASATEGDCLRAASGLGEGLRSALEALTSAWIRAAYLGETPEETAMASLCEHWRSAFGGNP